MARQSRFHQNGRVRFAWLIVSSLVAACASTDGTSSTEDAEACEVGAMKWVPDEGPGPDCLRPYECNQQGIWAPLGLGDVCDGGLDVGARDSEAGD